MRVPRGGRSTDPRFFSRLLFRQYEPSYILTSRYIYLGIKITMHEELLRNMKTPHGADTWLVIRKASYWLQRQGIDSIAATGLGIADFAVLKLLLFKGPLPINVIGAKVHLTSGSITTSIDRLEARGLVKRHRHPTDRRIFLAALTQRGRDKIAPASRDHAERMAHLVSVLTAAEQRELVRLMKRLGKHAMAIDTSQTESDTQRTRTSAARQMQESTMQ